VRKNYVERRKVATGKKKLFSLACAALFQSSHLGGLRLERLAGLVGLRGVLVELQFGALHHLARLGGLAGLVREHGAGAGHGDQREESDRLGRHHCRKFLEGCW